MISTRWLEKRKPYWTRLEQLLDQSTKRGFRSLGRSELQELGLLYRQIAADLAALREDRGSVHFARYLNQLLARAHNIIYSTHKASPSAIVNFFARTYPRIFRRNLPFVEVALSIFLASALVGAVLTFQDPDFKLSILGPQMVQTIEKREMWTHSIVGIKPLASSAIMTNNMSVGFMDVCAGYNSGARHHLHAAVQWPAAGRDWHGLPPVWHEHKALGVRGAARRTGAARHLPGRWGWITYCCGSSVPKVFTAA